MQKNDTLTNYTRNITVKVGQFNGDFDYYVKLLDWSKEDKVVAYCETDFVIHMNPKAPRIIDQMDGEGVWEMCLFAAKKLGTDPEKFYLEFLRDGCDETPYTEISLAQILEIQKNTTENNLVAK